MFVSHTTHRRYRETAARNKKHSTAKFESQLGSRESLNFKRFDSHRSLWHREQTLMTATNKRGDIL